MQLPISKTSIRITLLLGSMLAMVGCSTPSMQPGDLSLVQTTSNRPKAGNVYLLRGFIGIWSTGIDQLGAEINQLGIRATVYRCEQWRELTDAILEKYKDQKSTEPLIIIGHSWGADHALDLAHELEAAHIPIDLIITLDPVTPPTVPGNVRWCHNVYQTNGFWQPIPYFRGVALDKEKGSTGKLENLNIRKDRTDLLEPDTDHYNIEKNVKIHKEVIMQLQKVCLPREEWVRLHPGSKAAIAKAPVAGAAIATPIPKSMSNLSHE
jgi:hypothetical protein